jgi:hypothetical protein
VGLLARTIVFGVTDPAALGPVLTLPSALTVLPMNVAPIVTGALANNFTVGNDPEVLAPALTITDSSAMLSSATVTIGIPALGDTLAWTIPANSVIHGEYLGGTLTLTGNASVAEYQQVLQSVTFSTTSLGLAARTVSFQVVDDGGLPSVSLPMVMTVLPNAIPLVTSSLVGVQLPFVNGANPMILDPGIVIVDDSSSITGAVVTIGGISLGANDELSFAPPADSGIVGVWDPGSKTLVMSGSATVAQYQAALQSVSFATSGGVLGLNLGLRSVSFVVTDLQGATSVSVPLTVLVV